ncbi:MAG: acyltransferase family protein [Mangrovicoccus sp.]
MAAKSDHVMAIQALRAFAVSWVVIDHAFPVLPGGFLGVDIFFVISGFLITSHLSTKIAQGQFSFTEFYLRRARRLLPTALFVLLVTGIASSAILPPAWLAETFLGIAMSAIYVVNWFLAAISVDYFADAGLRSPVQHYWSLSVEEQFYIIWPAILMSVWWITGRLQQERSQAFRNLGMVTVLGLAAVSLSVAENLVREDATTTYFLTYTRAWEFAAGGIVAFACQQNWTAGPAILRPILAILAWAMLIASGWVLGPESGVPGFAAVPVVLATMVLLFLGDRHGIPKAGLILNSRPIQFLGDISYSLYLWHWPVLAIAPFALGVENLDLATLLGLLALTLVLSALTKRFVEDYFRFDHGDRSLLAGRPSLQLMAYLALSIGIAAMAWNNHKTSLAKSEAIAEILYEKSRNPEDCFGARAQANPGQCPNSHQLADKFYALQSWKTQKLPLPHRDGQVCQTKMGVAEPLRCSFGAPTDRARRHIALIGDSHAGMWMSALGQFVEEDSIRVTTFLASSCPATDATSSFAYYLPKDKRQACLDWRKEATRQILEDPQFDMVVTSASAYNLRSLGEKGWEEEDGTGFATVWQRFIAAGKAVVVIDDVPLLREKLPDCLARPHPVEDPCGRPSNEVPQSNPLSRGVEQMPPGSVSFLPLRDVFCDVDRCHAVIGGIPAYMDKDHISAPMARSLAERLRPLIDRIP